MTKFFSDTFIKVLTATEFRKLWISQVLSQVSLHLINFLIILRIFEATESSVAVSLVWLFYALPAIILGPFSGTIIDLASRRKILFATNAAQAVTVLFYLPAQETVWPIYSIIFIYALLNQIFVPAEAATVPFLVPKELFPAANTLFIFTIYASFLVSFGLAGPLVKAIGNTTPFVLISILLGIAAAIVYRLPEEEEKRKARTPKEFWDRFFQGYQFIQERPMVLFPLLLLMASGVLIPMIAVLAPAISVKILGIPLIETSTTLIVPAGIGAILGAIAVVRTLRQGAMRKKKVIAWGVFVAAISLLWISLAVPNLGNKPLMGAVGTFGLGWAFAMVVVPTQTLLQEQTPDKLRGRVFGALNFLITAVSILPVIFAATMAEFFGEIPLLLAISGLLFLLGLASLSSEQLSKVYATLIR